jgi:hypothetical protein
MKQVEILRMDNKLSSIIIEGFQLIQDDLSADTFTIPAELLRGVFVRQIPNDISLVLRKFDAQEQVYTTYPADIHISTKGTHRAVINFTELGQQSQAFLDTLHRQMAYGYNSIPIQEPVGQLSNRVKMTTRTFDPIFNFVENIEDEAEQLVETRSSKTPGLVYMPDRELIKLLHNSRTRENINNQLTKTIEVK